MINNSSKSKKKKCRSKRTSSGNIFVSATKSKQRLSNKKGYDSVNPQLNYSRQDDQLTTKENSMLLRKDYKKQYESVAGFLNDYQKILDSKVKSLENKWNSVQILQKQLQQSNSRESSFQQPKNLDNLLEIQNNFYIEKITQLQKALRKKEQQCKEARKVAYDLKRNTSYEDIMAENLRLKEEMSIIERQNKVLKNKLKEAKIL